MADPTEKKLDSWHRRALAVSEDSHDSETKVGAILIHRQTGAVLSSGFNGFIRGANDKKLPNKRPEKYPYMQHAEANLLWNCARHGISTDNCILYCTLSPCINCVRGIWQSGINEVYFKDKYRDFDANANMLDMKLLLRKPFSTSKYYHLRLEPR